jgi:hypothetical protein
MVFATVQLCDKLIYNGIKYNIKQFPMETFFLENPEKRPRGNTYSTGLNRRYIATYELTNDGLLLNDIEVENYTNGGVIERVSVLSEFLQGQEYFRIDWYIGIIEMQISESYVFMYYPTGYYKIIIIENGILINEYNLNSSQYNEFSALYL